MRATGILSLALAILVPALAPAQVAPGGTPLQGNQLAGTGQLQTPFLPATNLALLQGLTPAQLNLLNQQSAALQRQLQGDYRNLLSVTPDARMAGSVLQAQQLAQLRQMQLQMANLGVTDPFLQQQMALNPSLVSQQLGSVNTLLPSDRARALLMYRDLQAQSQSNVLAAQQQQALQGLGTPLGSAANGLVPGAASTVGTAPTPASLNPQAGATPNPGSLNQGVLNPQAGATPVPGTINPALLSPQAGATPTPLTLDPSTLNPQAGTTSAPGTTNAITAQFRVFFSV